MKKISLRNIFYSLPALSFAIPTFPVMIMLPAFFAEVHYFDIAIIGTYIFLAKLIDIASDPIVGWINDKKILDHGMVVGKELAYVLSGGDTNLDKEISEDQMFKLELDSFMKLIETKKTQDRITHTLKTGKPLIN